MHAGKDWAWGKKRTRKRQEKKSDAIKGKGIPSALMEDMLVEREHNRKNVERKKRVAMNCLTSKEGRLEIKRVHPRSEKVRLGRKLPRKCL